MNLISVAIVLSSSISVEAFAPPARQGGPVHQRAQTTQLLGILGRFRKKKEVVEDIPAPIEVGATIPEVDVEVLTTNDEGEIVTMPATINEVLGDSTSILVGMPGAFTPTCSEIHLPGYIESSAKLKKLGVDQIAIVTQNDKYVNKEWAKSVGLINEGGDGKMDILETPVTIVSDGDGDLIKAMGLAGDMGFGLGVRSKRFALVSKAGQITNLLVDEGITDCVETSAMNLVALLGPTEGENATEGDSSAVLAAVGAIAIATAAYFFLMSDGSGGSTAGVGASVGASVGTSGGQQSFSLLKDYF